MGGLHPPVMVEVAVIRRSHGCKCRLRRSGRESAAALYTTTVPVTVGNWAMDRTLAALRQFGVGGPSQLELYETKQQIIRTTTIGSHYYSTVGSVLYCIL